MKLALSTVLKTVRGEPLKVDEKTPATLKWAAVEALMGNIQGETLTGIDKVQRYKLAQKVQGGTDDSEFSIDEVAKTKELIGKFFPISVTGAAYEVIEACGSTPPPT